MRRILTRLAIAVMGLLLSVPLTADAQASGKVYRIGLILTAAPNEVLHVIEALDGGLRELGYVEGRNRTSSIAICAFFAPQINR